MTECVCCQQGHKNVKAKTGDPWCRQCQKDGCPQPTIYCEKSDADKKLLEDLYEAGLGIEPEEMGYNQDEKRDDLERR